MEVVYAVYVKDKSINFHSYEIMKVLLKFVFMGVLNVDVKHWEVDGDQLVLYLDRISREMTCFSIILVSRVEITDALPAIVTLFDYYYPERTVSKVSVYP